MASAGSAMIGQPPNTPRDVNIVRGWYRRIGMVDADPTKGYVLAARPPPGYTPESKQAGIIGAMVGVILAIVVPTVARLIARSRGKHTRLGSDDWAIVVAASVAVVYPILQIVAVVEGQGGRHTWEATYENYQALAYYLGIARHIFYIAVGLIKVSIALFVRRIAHRASRAWTIVADVFLATVGAYILVALFWNIYICSPPRAAWDLAYSGALETPVRCGNGTLSTKTLSTLHVVQGACLLLTPVFILWKVQMDAWKKARLFVIWATGGFAVLGGLLQHLTTVIVTDDVFWQYPGILVWVSVDLCLGMLTASLPVLDAAIMGSLRAARTKISSSGRMTRGGTAVGDGYTLGTGHTRSVIRGGSKKEYSESVEGIIGKDEGTEMTILRTDEVRLDYEAADRADGPHADHR